MEDNLARKIELEEDVMWEEAYTQPITQPYEEVTPSIQSIPQAEPVAKGLTKFELFLIGTFAMIIFTLTLFNISSSLELSTASRGVQDVNAEIAQTKIEIENLTQQTHELSRYDRIQEIAEKYGLDLHKDNIINIAPQE